MTDAQNRHAAEEVGRITLRRGAPCIKQPFNTTARYTPDMQKPVGAPSRTVSIAFAAWCVSSATLYSAIAQAIGL
jgi:hypothetical protein